MTDHPNRSAGSARLAALASRIAEIEPSWLPMAGHVRNVTFTLDEADLVILALTRPTAPAQPVAWTNEHQLGYLKDPEWASVPMAMWGKPNGAARIPLYASQPSPAATVETKSAPPHSASQLAERAPSSDAAPGGADTQCSAGTVDVAKIREWADDFEAAAGDVPKGIKSTVLMTRAQEVRSYIDQLTSAPGRASTLSALDDASNACLELAKKHGFATGHGDTVAGMIREFSAQITNEPQAALMQKIEAEARRYAEMYPQSSDGRNTFVIFADWVASQGGGK